MIMRMLFTFAGGSGHFEPLVPMARAAQAAGHIVAFSGEPALAPTVEQAGFTMFPSGPNTNGRSGGCQHKVVLGTRTRDEPRRCQLKTR
jgi:UDP:flavonoid glycosyltransferase YjiC (YdhE family)